jgi:methylphosphotriester-DNA--protein-cysteine methyltransferase
MAMDITLIKSYVQTNLGRVHKTQHVADQLDCPLDKLKKTFYRSEKLTLSRFIRESRLARIKEQLAQSDSPCKVICIDLGIREDVGARLFKNATGLTMEEFRKMHRGSISSIWRTEAQKQAEFKSSPHLMLTARAVKHALASSRRSRIRRSVNELAGVTIQGHAN